MRTVLAALTALLLAGCIVVGTPTDPTGTTEQPPPPGPPTTLRVLAGSELADMRPILEEAAAATGVTVELSFAGSLEGAETVADGRADADYDAVWFSSTRYLESIPEARQRLAGSARIMGSPVVLGVRESVAARLGWDGDAKVTWSDIADAAGRGEFAFAMTDPAASNTGFSALVAVASALDGSGRALDAAAVDRVVEPLVRFFSAQRLTAGSSGWLTDAFVRRLNGADPGAALDGLISYEASLVTLDRSGALPERLRLVYPTDGVVSADYPLTLLGSAAEPARAAHQRLTDHLRRAEVQRAITERTARRPAVPEVPPAAGLPTGLVELPFPDTRDAMDALLTAYYDRIRRPARTVYVLDTSGSMAGERLAALQNALVGLTGADTSLSGRYCRFRGREDVVLLPFNERPGDASTFTIDAADPTASHEAIRAAVGRLQAVGNTAVYDSLLDAYRLLDLAGTADRFASVVLMTDGESNRGGGIDAFRTAAAARGDGASVPVFPILFGEAAQAQMAEVATVTGGLVFDARDGDLARAFCEIRGYQ